MTSHGIARRVGFAVAVVAAVGVAGLAQPPRDPIDAARAAQKIADQKAAADVARAIQDADSLARTNPVKAVQALRAAQANIDLSASVSAEARRALTAQLQAKVARLEGRPALDTGAKPDATGTGKVKADKQAVFEAYLAEVKTVNAGVALVKQFQETNRTAEANREIARLTAKYPDNPAVLALTQKDTFGRNVDESRQFARMQSERLTLAQNDVMRSSLPAKGDIEFPKDWKERTKNRTTEVKLSAKERALIEALDKPVTLSFNGRSLEEALQELSNEMNQPLLVDRKALDDLGVDLKKPVTLDAKGISARTVLRQLVGAQGLTFLVKDETIQVVTVEKARESLVTRVYYLGDLVQGVGPFGGALTWGPLVDYQQTMANVQLITDAIQDSIDPLSWKKRGGPCTVTFHFPSMSLVVRASTEVHAVLGSKLR